MENFEDFMKLNESSISNEMVLLSNLFNFYLQKYSKKIAKIKFKEQVEFLKNQGEVSTKVVNKFFKENDIPVETVSKSKKSDDFKEREERTLRSYSSNAGCGGISSNVGCGSISNIPSRNSSGCGSINVGC
jgi:nanoRNase/pAp phosphatase (c-di-AMP/oligoRNAs hydrolase)